MATKHNDVHVGLQNHSIGELYPWSIVRIGDRCEQPRQLVSGELGPEYKLGERYDGELSAYQKAENWIRNRTAPNSAGKYVDAQRELAELAYSPNDGIEEESLLEGLYKLPEKFLFCEYSFLIPVQYPDGSTVGQEFFSSLERSLLDKFDGFTRKGLYRGSWRNPKDGNVENDICTKYFVAIDECDKPKLVELLHDICVALGQDCIYLTSSADCVEFVR